MQTLIYMSDIDPAWPFERQESLLGDLLGKGVLFVDRISAHRGRDRRSSDPLERDRLLAQAAVADGGSWVVVASHSVLARDEAEFMGLLERLQAPAVVLVSLSSKRNTLDPAEWRAARRASRLQEAARRGGAVAGTRRREISLEKWALIKDRWHLKEHSGAALLREAGLTRNTVNALNGGKNREALIAAHERRLRRKQA